MVQKFCFIFQPESLSEQSCDSVEEVENTLPSGKLTFNY